MLDDLTSADTKEATSSPTMPEIRPLNYGRFAINVIDPQTGNPTLQIQAIQGIELRAIVNGTVITPEGKREERNSFYLVQTNPLRPESNILVRYKELGSNDNQEGLLDIHREL